MKRTVLLSLVIGTVAGPVVAGPTEDAASDAVGVFCVPVMISGRLTSDDQIESSGFVPGTQAHPETLPTPSFQRTLDNGDVVEVFIAAGERRCTVHVHGDPSVRDGYLTALHEQNWTAAPIEDRVLDSGARITLLQVNFGPHVGRAVQSVLIAPDGITNPATPQIVANMIGRD